MEATPADRNRQRSRHTDFNPHRLLVVRPKPQSAVCFFLTIFAVWDIFYYVWLKVLIKWPASIMDWDILFLMPTVWAGPVVAPILITVIMLAFAIIILYRSCDAKPLKSTLFDQFIYVLAALLVVASFCIAGLHATQPDFTSHFHWSLFAAGLLSALLVFTKCLLQSK